ncbi:Farnesylcysteine lyase [Vitis vinifera]|uniref:Farnesylcysteine lyase n=1 Tax=Vitis vinifera TaxID=29760 RepID=A0A438F4T7_VITVI|nr:Farnesylcysteine lyase [Vitis vinifera]
MLALAPLLTQIESTLLKIARAEFTNGALLEEASRYDTLSRGCVETPFLSSTPFLFGRALGLGSEGVLWPSEWEMAEGEEKTMDEGEGRVVAKTALTSFCEPIFCLGVLYGMDKESQATLNPISCQLSHELIMVKVSASVDLLVQFPLAGSGGGLWSVERGNWQIVAGLINHSDVVLHRNEEIESISYHGEYYELNSTKGNSYKCEVAVIATPLDELNIHFNPPISIPKRKLQHTHATFVRAYFGLVAVSEIPELVGTLEDPNLPFSSISVLRKHDEKDMSYKIFSRKPMADVLLDRIFSLRKETIRINWGAYPHYSAPEVFAPFVLDGRHLYYVNAFENAASTMETSAVAAENIARLILSRYSGLMLSSPSNLKSPGSDEEDLHSDL